MDKSSINKNIISLILIIIISFSDTYAQDLSIQTGHSATITDLKFTPDDKYLISCGLDNKVIIWDMSSFMQMKLLIGHKAPINAIAMNTNNNTFATASNDKTVKIWNYPNGDLIKEYKFTEAVKSIDYSPNGETLVCATDSIIFINTTTNIRTKLNIKARKTFSTVKFSSNGAYVGFGGKNEYFVYIYELTYKNYVQKFRSQSNSVIFDIDNIFVFSAGDNGVIKRRTTNNSSGKKFTLWANNKWDTFFDIEQTKDYFIAANRNNLIYVFENKTGKRIRLLNGHTKEPTTITASSGGKYLASAGKDRKIIIWNLEKFTITKVIQGGANSITSMAFSDDGNFMFLTYNDGSNRIWNLANKGQMLTNTAPEPNFIQKNFFNEYSSISSFYNINHEKIFILNSLDKINRKTETVDNSVQKPFIWDIQNSGKQLFIKNNKKDTYKQYFIADTNSIIEVVFNATHTQSKSFWTHEKIIDRQTVFSADVTIFAFSKKSKKKKIKTKNLFQKSEFTIQGDIYYVNISPDGEFMLNFKNTSNGLICDLWDLTLTQKISTVLLDKKYDSGGFSPSGNYFYIASSSDSIIKIYETSSQKLINTLSGITPFAFDKNNKLCTYTDNNKNLYLFNFQENKIIFKVKTGHQTKISDIKFNHQHKYIATSGFDGLINFWNIQTGQAIISLAAFDQTDFIYVDTNNYYYSTKGAMKYISFVLKNQLYTFDQFDIKFNRPDTVLASLDYTPASEIEIYKKAYLKRLKKMGFTNYIFDKNYNIPEINITNSSDIPISTDNKTITISIAAIDSIYELDRVNIWVNSVPIFGSNGKIIKNLHKKEYSNSFEITLSNGKNRIDVTTTNSQGAESLKKSFSIICETESPSDLYIISIGVSNYKDSTLNLDYAAKDASDVITLLGSKNKLFNEIHTYKLVNEQATSANILNMKSILKNTKVDDQVVLFFAGHGTLDQQYNYYLTTYEFDIFDFYNTVLKYEDFIDLVDSIPARKKVVFIDACHSGEIDNDNDDNTTGNNNQTNTSDTTFANGRSLWAQQFGNIPQFGKTQNSFELMKVLFADLRRGSGTTIISSAGGKEYAYESKKIQNGVFTYSLIAGLKSKKADLNNDGVIMLSEIQDYVMQSVSELTKGMQNPTNRRENLDYDFVIWR
ncbi:MAG: caspase family protein [Bacteroidales bacterium]|nr:caspase family protein [Bacteroidales bacterium]